MRLQRRVRALEAGRGVHHAGLGELGDVGTGALAAGLPQMFLSLRGAAIQYERQQVDLRTWYVTAGQQMEHR